MGLELRHGRLYYYRKRRDGNRVESEYVGGGMLAELAATLDHEAREEARGRAAAVEAEWQARRAEMDAEEARIAGYLHAVDTAVGRALEAAGFHRPSRKLQWIRHRGPRRPPAKEQRS
jgi:hypothetical protein